MKLPKKDYGRDKLSDPLYFWKSLILLYHSDSQQEKGNHRKHLNRENLIENISYINNGRTEKPNKQKGNPDIIDSGYSQRSLGWRDKAKGSASRFQP